MNTRTTLVLALVAAVVAGYWGYSESQKRREGDKPSKPESLAKELYSPKPKDIDRVEYVDGRGKKYVFKKDDNAWQLVEPIQSPANEYEVNGLVDRVGEIKYVKTYNAGDKDRPSDSVAGLDKPEAVVKLYTGDKLQADVMIGNRLPTGTGTYMRTGDSDVIYQADADLQTTFNKKLESFRDRRVVKFDVKDVTRVKVEGLQNYELSHKNGTWVVESPTRSRGDKEAIEKVVRPISMLYVQDWKDDEPIALRPYQLDKPRLRLTIDTAREIPAKNKPGDPNTQPADTQPSTEEKTVVLLIGGAVDPSATSYFAKLDSAPWVFALGESTYKELATSLTDLRDKKLVSADMAGEIIKIDSTTPSGQMTLSRNAKNEWTFADGTVADATAVDELVKTIQALKFSDFAGTDTLVSNDWNKPRGRVTVTRRGAGTSTTLLVGSPSASGQMVYVKNEAEEPIGAVPKAEADQLLAGPDTYKNRTVLKFPRDQATRIEIAKVDQDKVVLSKEVDKWKMLEPVIAEADADAIRNLVSDVSSLQAKRVVATGDKAKYGLDQPQVRLVVHTEVPVAKPAMTAPAVKPQPAATAPAVSKSDEATITTRPAVAATTRPAVVRKKTPQERIKQLEELLEYTTTTLRAEGKENPKATEMLREELEKARREAGVSTQPAIQGAPQAPEAEVAAAAGTQPAATTPAAPAPPEIKVYHLSLTQQRDGTKEGAIYAARDDQDIVYELDRKIFDDATAEMRDRQILKFEVANVIELGFEQAGTQVAVRKAGENWKYVPDPLVPIDDQKVTEKLNVFRDLKTHRYETYKGADAAKYGLDKDPERLWVLLNDGKRLEVILSKTGPVNDPDKSRYAALGSDPQSVFLLKGDQASKFQQKLEDFQKSAAAPAAGATPPPPPPGGLE